LVLSDREKFIHHFVTLTTVRVVLSKLADGEGGDVNVYSSFKDGDDMTFIIKKIQETRCRKLKKEEIQLLIDDLVEEALLGGNIINDSFR
tara:strand:+ start:5976 stop:6245 length:270 start_codon:yes stop_codon:yes gene_type:complete